MPSDLERLNHWKSKIEKAKQEKASLEGKQESLHERAVQLRETMESELGVETLNALEKKITEQEEKVASLASDLEEVFGEAA